MYSTCLFCNKPLGANEALESFPIGRRIAFDPARGRLWVVCRSCERWNLSPWDDRLDVIEDCERLYSDTRMRVSTENIGLAKLHEGLELVRIGQPMRPEFAAWRYGDQFGRRRRQRMIRVGLGAAALGTIWAGSAFAGVGIGGLWWQGRGIFDRIANGSKRKVVARIPTSMGKIEVRRKHLKHVVLGHDTRTGSWRIHVPQGGKSSSVLTGDEAQRATALLLPHINVSGGNSIQVQNAVNLLDVAGDPMQYVSGVARNASAYSGDGRLMKMPASVRLAIEMATHEEAERRALEGELKSLELAWKEAEEVADISDSLLLPKSISEQFEKLRGKLQA